jgi:hypothetical protein
MSTVEEIERAVAQLAPRELAAFRAWFEAFEAERFDKKIAHDAASGRLDKIADQAIADYRESRARIMRHFASPSFWALTKSCPRRFAIWQTGIMPS